MVKFNIYKVRRLVKNEFILKSIDVHGDKYDYSKVDYINCMSKVIIICQEHGEFEQTPLNHMQGNMCKKCSSNIVGINQRKNNEFIEKSNIKYDYKYDYSKVNYINRKVKIIIICPVHGEFMETPINHISRNGCNQCSKLKRIKINADNFIDSSKKIHYGKYNYSLVNYKTDKIKVDIICHIHGIFSQTPGDHSNGRGCPTCSSSKGEVSILNYLIDNNISFNREYKFTDCVYVNNLLFDFYIPSKNICIEYDGKQHSKPINFFGGLEGFEKIKVRDDIKNNYCMDNNIKLIRIPYNEYKNINKILDVKLWEN